MCDSNNYAIDKNIPKSLCDCVLHCNTTPSLRLRVFSLVMPFNLVVLSFQITKKLLRKHFQLFGAIDYFTLHLKLNYCYGFIQFTSVYSAASALRSQHHYVSGFRIKVSAADSWHQPRNTEEETAPQNDEASVATETDQSEDHILNILDLNDDCLFDIFNMLNCIDLSAVDQTCTRFQRVASDVFRRKHTAINLTMTELPGYSNVGNSQLTLFQIRNLLRGYGAQIQKIHVAALSFKQENRYRVLDLIIRNCKTLKSLCLTGFYIKVCHLLSFFALHPIF